MVCPIINVQHSLFSSSANSAQFFDYATPPNLFNLIEKDEDNRFPLKVISKDLISPDTYRMELEFPNKDWIAGMWPAGHMKLFLDIDGK